jgi:beta-lactamase regulating signal transducer with metallopeptidase domain
MQAASKSDDESRDSLATKSRSQSAQAPTAAMVSKIATDSAPARENEAFSTWRFASAAALVVGLYAVVAGVLALRLVGSLAAVARLTCGCSRVDASAWADGKDQWTAKLGIKRSVTLLLSDEVSVPIVAGVLRPAIILPRSLADTASQPLIDAVLLHELAHIRRCDFTWNLVGKLAQCIYWPHPLVWPLGRIVAQVREQACDDLCVYGLGGATAYHDALLEVASGLVRRPEPALGMAMARTMKLARRLAWINESRAAARPRAATTACEFFGHILFYSIPHNAFRIR